jgi:hypothetical protein
MLPLYCELRYVKGKDVCFFVYCELKAPSKTVVRLLI